MLVKLLKRIGSERFWHWVKVISFWAVEKQDTPTIAGWVLRKINDSIFLIALWLLGDDNPHFNEEKK